LRGVPRPRLLTYSPYKVLVARLAAAQAELKN